MNIVVDALVNDTTGTLLTGALEDHKCAIGLILGNFSVHLYSSVGPAHLCLGCLVPKWQRKA